MAEDEQFSSSSTFRTTKMEYEAIDKPLPFKAFNRVRRLARLLRMHSMSCLGGGPPATYVMLAEEDVYEFKQPDCWEFAD